MKSDGKIKVAGYVKLAKLWERDKEKSIKYHNDYYRDKYSLDKNIELVGVYIDITGQRYIRKRPEMVRLLKDCTDGKIDIIAIRTRAYLAASSAEFCYLIYYLFNLPHTVNIISEDDNYNINTITNEEDQKEELLKMASNYINLFPEEYKQWKTEITEAIDKLRKDI